MRAPSLSFFHTIPGGLRALILMGVVVAGGVVGFMLLASMSFLHALYATVITVTTVGFRDLPLAEVMERDPALADRVMLFEIFLVV